MVTVLKGVMDEIAGSLTNEVVVVPSNPLSVDAHGKVSRLLRKGQSSGAVVAGWLPAGTQDMRSRIGQPNVISDFDSADLSGVCGTPTFINGRRHHGAYDIDTLSAAARAARATASSARPLPGITNTDLADDWRARPLP